MKLATPHVLVLLSLGLVLVAGAGLPLLLYGVSPSAPALIRVEGEQLHPAAGGVIRFEDRGAGRHALVFLHGFNGQLGHWNAVWSRLDGCGRALRLDAPGFGGSNWDTTDFSLPAQARRVIDFLDARGIERATLVGTSMGGSLAAWIAATHPDRVERVLLLAPSGYPDSLHYAGPYGLLVRPGLPNRVAAAIARSGAYRAAFPDSRLLQAVSVTASYGAPWAEALGRIQAPVLLMWSRSDKSFHAAAQVAAAIPRGRLVTLAADAGHLLPETRPELAAEAACRLARGEDLDQLQQALAPLLAARGDG